MSIKIYPYRTGSKSAKALAEALGCRRLRLNTTPYRSRYRWKNGDAIINWGNSEWPYWSELYHPTGDAIINWGNWVNRPPNVGIAQNKLHTLNILQENEISCPEFTTDRSVALEWLLEGSQIVCRELLRASGGRGITLVSPPVTELPVAPLYVKYIKKFAEYRIHVVGGEVIDVQQKRKRREDDEVNYQIRNHDNGWVFCRDGVILPEGNLEELAVLSVTSLGLDFGAVDIIWNRRHNRGYVLEVNTAPGLEGQTIQSYANTFRRMLG